MSGFVQTIVLGRLGGDPELSYTQGGTPVAKFSVATSRKRKDSDEEVTTWLRWKAFGKQAEVLAQHAKKGELLFVEGRPDTYPVESARGAQVTVTEFIVEHFEFAGGGRARGDAGERPSTRYQDGNAPRRASSPRTRGAARGPAERDSQQLDRNGGAFDDDIPF